MAQPYTPRQFNNQPKAPVERGPIINLNIAAMWATIPGTTEKAKFMFSMQDGNPRAVVWYNTQEKQKPVSCHMKANDMKAVTLLVEKMSDEGKPFKIVIGSLMADRNDQGKMTGKRKVTEWYIGMDDDGVYWTGIKDLVNPRKAVKFQFLMEDWHDISIHQGNEVKQIDKAVASKLMFRAAFGLLSDYLGFYTRSGFFKDDPSSLDAPVIETKTSQGGSMPSALPDFDDISM